MCKYVHISKGFRRHFYHWHRMGQWGRHSMDEDPAGRGAATDCGISTVTIVQCE